MKSLTTLATAALMLLSAGTVSAQSANAPTENNENAFHPYWSLQVQGGIGHTVGETKFGDLISPAASLSFSYQASKLFGIRAGVSGWQAKGAVVMPDGKYKFNYLQGNVDATLDLGNLFGGYKPRRVVNPYLFVGVGVNGAFNNDEAVRISERTDLPFEYLWTDNKVSVAGRAGIGANFRVSDRVAINAEVNSNILTDKFNSKKAENVDWQSNLLVGLTIRLGKSQKPQPVPVEEELPTPQPQEEQPVAPVQEVETQPAVETAPAEVVEEKQETTDVFFTINSSYIRPAEMQKVNALISHMKENPECRVLLTGYADKATGTPEVNMRISRKRAQAVRKALQKAGIAPERIVVAFKGDTEQPFEVISENRVCICLLEAK